MNLSDLITAVHRDCQAINPKAYCYAGCRGGDYGFGKGLEIRFEIYHEGSLRDDLPGAFYHGNTPDEAYDKFLAAVMQPAAPSLAEVLELCDMPAAVGLMP